MDRSIISKLVKAVGVSQQDIVLVQLWGENDQLAVLDDFCYEIAKIGATPMKYQHSKIYYKNIFENVALETELYGKDFLQAFNPVTVVIDLMAYRPVVPGQDFPVDKLPAYKKYMSNIFRVLSQKEKFVQLRLPTPDMAEEAQLPYESFREKIEAAYNIDYDILSATCEEMITALSNSSLVEIRTGPEHLLKLSVQDRTWQADSGNGDLPAGEIFIAPIEDSAEGSLWMEKAYFDGTLYEGLELQFKEGKLITTNDKQFNEMLEEFPPGGNILGELGIGLNKQINTLTGYTVLDEKAYGTCHIALGMNHLFGGKNECPLHEDIVFKGSLDFDHKILIEDGIIKLNKA